MIQLRGATTFSFNMQKKWLSYKPVACTILRRQNLSTMFDKLSTSESAGWFLEGNNKKTGKISTIGHFLMPYFFLQNVRHRRLRRGGSHNCFFFGLSSFKLQFRKVVFEKKNFKKNHQNVKKWE